MIQSTSAISLKYYKYSESSVVAKLFTESQGMQSYVIKGLRSKKSKKSLNLLTPLNILQIEVSNNPKMKIQYVKDIQNKIPLTGIYTNMKKKFISMFIAEILIKVLVEKEKELTMYKFIEKTILDLNKSANLNPNYPIIFLLKLSEYLGFYPLLSLENKDSVLDLNSSEIYKTLSHENILYLQKIMNNQPVVIPSENKAQVLQSIQKYYRAHHYNIENLKSYEVIRSLK